MSGTKATEARRVRPATVSDDDVRDVDSALTEAFSRDAQDPSVCVVDGYGVRLSIRGRHLVVEDGFGPQHRRIRRYSRIHGLRRLVVMGESGSASVEVHRWCAGAGVQVVLLDSSNCTVLATSGATSGDDARIRRAQALAMGTDTGLEIARYLISTKLHGQGRLAAGRLGQPNVASSIESITAMVDDAESLEEIRQLEATAANLYWHSWEAVELRFVRRDESKVPDHWRRFTGRRSAVYPGSARGATSAVTALQNLSYRLLEAEGRLATLTVGLDPGLGILHADMRARDGFVLDLIEACRPISDGHILQLIQERTFPRLDFGEDSRGIVRVLPPLSHRLAEWMPFYGAALAPVVEKVREMLAAASPYDVVSASYLTRVKHKEAARRRARTSVPGGSVVGVGPGVEGIAPRRSPRQRPPTPDAAPRLPLPVCETCGTRLERESDRRGTRARYCTSCTAVRRVEIGDMIQKLPKKRRPISEETAKRRATANRSRRLQELEWERQHEGEVFDREWYLLEVLPGLQRFSLTSIAKATGLSTSTASRIRRGRVPHSKWWSRLHSLVLS
jgi:CRISPR-associated endonuclease Cas1